MTLYLYTVLDDPRVVHKTLGGTVLTINANPTDEKDIIEPTFIVNSTTQISSNYNYLKVHEYGRYYFITDMSLDKAKNLIITTHVDVLKTYEDIIPEINGMIIRSTKATGEMVDKSLPINENIKEISIVTANKPIVSLANGLEKPDVLLFTT